MLQRRIDELADQIKAYERLLDELPELFERKFQQRLEPLVERYQLLVQQLDSSTQNSIHPALLQSEEQSGISSHNNLMRLPRLRLPKLPGFGKWRSA